VAGPCQVELENGQLRTEVAAALELQGQLWRQSWKRDCLVSITLVVQNYQSIAITTTGSSNRRQSTTPLFDRSRCRQELLATFAQPSWPNPQATKLDERSESG